MLGWMFATAQASTTVDQERPAPPEELGISVDVGCGSVTVRGDDVVKVKVTGTVDNPDSLSVSTSPGHVSIAVDGRSLTRNCGQLVVTVPRAAAVDVETISAPIQIDGVQGSLDLESTSGSITVGTSGCGVDAESISGSISVRGAVKRAEVSTVSGSILIDQVVGPVQAESVSGAIRISGGAALPSISAETVSASITVAAALAPRAHVHLQTHSGAIVFALPEASSARVGASTMSGAVSSAFGPTRAGEHALTLGDGTADVSLESFSGAITISRLEPR